MFVPNAWLYFEVNWQCNLCLGGFENIPIEVLYVLLQTPGYMLKLTGSVTFVLEVLKIFPLKCCMFVANAWLYFEVNWQCNLCLGGFGNIPIEVLHVCCKRLVIC